jgi:hypothetical protein
MLKYYAALVPSANAPKGANPVALGQPLTENSIQRDLERRRGQDQQTGAGWATAGTAVTLSDTDAKDALAQRTREIKMYVDATAFQVRSFLTGDQQKPDEEQIFNSAVDTWVQWDMVQAIAASNARAADVTQSPVKRLVSISVGASANGNAPIMAAGSSGQGGGSEGRIGGPDMAAIARMIGQARGAMGNMATAGGAADAVVQATGHSASGPIFLGMGRAPAAPANPAAQLGFVTGGSAPAGPTGPDYSLSLTGHSPNDRFDLTYVRLVVEVDPSRLNDFIGSIYRQNNSYTVVNMSLQSVDPLEAASTGYLYGDTPVVRADLLLEAIFFRDWTLPIMPASVKSSLGIADPNAQAKK